MFEVVDEVVEVPDSMSIAGAWQLQHLLGRAYGGSSGTNLAACLSLAAGMQARGEQGAIVTLLCDRGDRYGETLFDPGWLQAQGVALAPARARLERAIATGADPLA